MNRILSSTIVVVFCSLIFLQSEVNAQPNLEAKLKTASLTELAHKVKRKGSARRGALVFYTSTAACVKCHSTNEKQATPLGPALTKLGKDVKTEAIIESILSPSKSIKKGYETRQILLNDGKVITGLLVKEDANHFVLRDQNDLQKEIQIKKSEVDSVMKSKTSLMPVGLVSAFREERDFYDLVQYLSEIAQGGEKRVAELKPAPELLEVKDDIQNLDHAGILANLGEKDLQRGKRIYQSHCVNCHGPDGNQPTLATARAFGRDQLKYGSDPYRMLKTLTFGNGLMGSMQHLSPKERYQVIHFIREQFMQPSHPEYAAITNDYLKSLPEGEDQGDFLKEGDRDFGPVLGSQLGNDINNSLNFRLKGNVTLNYDLHRFRLGGVWEDGFLNLSETQHYRQRGERMPRPVGTPLAGLDEYAWEFNGSFDITDEIKLPRGPVDSGFAKYHGHYLYGDQAILHYEISGRKILEAITSTSFDKTPVVQHTFHLRPGGETVRLGVGKQTRPGKILAEATSHFAYVPTAQVKGFENGQHSNVARHVVPATQAKNLDLGIPNRTVVARFKTSKGGTLIASAPPEGRWVPNGKTLFIRGGRVVFDIGWVGAMTGETNVADNMWHTVTLVVAEDETKLFVDGELQRTREEFRRAPVAGHVLKLGSTATNFGGDFSGQISSVSFYDFAMSNDQVAKLIETPEVKLKNPLWKWIPDSDTLLNTDQSQPKALQPMFAVSSLSGDTDGLRWSFEDQRLVLTIPPSEKMRLFRLSRTTISEQHMQSFQKDVRFNSAETIVDPEEMTHGGPTRWPQRLATTGSLGESIEGYALDTISVPFENPWNAWMRTSALDFFEDGRCVVTTHGGDVYIVSGIDDQLKNVTWKRFAAGLFEPFGVRVINGTIYVTCRDGLKRLHDYDGNDEADYVEAFWNDDDVSSMFHAYNFDLQTDSAGNFYFAKAGQYTRHHRPGTIMKIPPGGGDAEVVAWGLRTPNGMGKLFDDRFTVSDNQGPWMPAGKISLIEPGGFYGNMPINDEQEEWLRNRYDGELPEKFDEPIIWMPQELDNSCGGQVWAGDERWGPLSGRLIHSSFGKGWLYYLSLQKVQGKTQASIVSLPHQWDAGVMRLRVNPADGQMYGTGLSGWQGPKGGEDGCLQRLRYTGEEARIIENVRVVPSGIELTFNFKVSEEASQQTAWEAQMWDYLWSKRYGSDQFSVLKPDEKGRDQLTIESIQISDDKKTVTLNTPDLKICDQVYLEMGFRDVRGQRFNEQVHLTVHGIPEE